jgi:hypothetical protein
MMVAGRLYPAEGTTMVNGVLLIGEVAEEMTRRLGRRITPKKLRELCMAGKLDEPERLGPFRVFTRAGLPAIEKALRDMEKQPAGG